MYRIDTVVRCIRDLLSTQGALAIVDNHAYLMEGTKEAIHHEVTSNGITANLSKHLPSHVTNSTGFFVDGLLNKNGLGRNDSEYILVMNTAVCVGLYSPLRMRCGTPVGVTFRVQKTSSEAPLHHV